MKYLAMALLVVLCVSSGAYAVPPVHADFYVSPAGNDAWSGKQDQPNAAHSDGPFATLDKARLAVRELKKAGNVTICLRGGTYFLNEPLVFTPEDSGKSADQPNEYFAYPGEQPIVSGGVRLPRMHINNLQQWELTLPEVVSGKWTFSQLFADSTRRLRPRLPQYGYYSINASVAPTVAVAARGYDRFGYKPGDMNPNWYDPNAIETLCFQTWTMARLRVASINDATHVVSFTGPTNGTAGYAALPRGNRYILENVREALQDPGEWYLDRKTGVLTYLPVEGETLEKTALIAPRLAQVIIFRGDAAAHKWVENISFENIRFAHTNWNSPPEGNAFAQAEVNVNAAISAVGARHCSFVGCSVVHTGNWAIELGAGCKGNTIENCDLHDLGAGGVKIGEMGIQQDTEQVASGNTIKNCEIMHCGRIHPAATGVWIGQSPDNQIVHNHIADLYYTGISAGWTWGYGNSLTRNNLIAYNLIEDIGQGVLSDMGGIYTLGISTGTVLDHNVIRNVESFDYGGWGIYPDEGSSNLTITNNIVYRTKTGGFHQHYGENNLISNNIFAFSREGQIIRTRAEDHLSFKFDHNIVYFKEGTLLGSNWSGDQFRLSNNVYWDASERPITFAGQTLEEWQKHGQDIGSIIADPLFTAPDSGIFHLKPESPAIKLGFKPIDWSQVGPHPLKGQHFEYTPAPRAFPPPPPPAPPAPIEEDFESAPVGAVAPDASTSEEPGGGTVRVTDETAASGKHCLKFTDTAGQKFSYNPHIFFQTKFEAGVLTGSFAIRLEPGAIFSHEWRDNSNPYNTGPSIRIDGEGYLYAGNRKLQLLPLSKWVTISIECGVGLQATGSYTLTVRFPDMTFKRYQDIQCSPLFKKLTWFGFVSATDGPSVFYIDDVKLHQ